MAFALAYYLEVVRVVDLGGTEGKLEVMMVWTQVASMAVVALAGPTAADTVATSELEVVVAAAAAEVVALETAYIG